MSQSKSMIFSIGGQRMSIAAGAVQEVIANFEIVEMPKAPANMLGTINLRGRLVSIFDLQMAMTGNRTELTPLQSCVLLLSIEDVTFGVLVEDVLRVEPLLEESLSELDPHLAREYKGLISQAYTLDEGLVLKLEFEFLKDYLGYKEVA